MVQEFLRLSFSKKFESQLEMEMVNYFVAEDESESSGEVASPADQTAMAKALESINNLIEVSKSSTLFCVLFKK